MLKTIIITVFLVLPYSISNAVLPMNLDNNVKVVMTIEEEIKLRLLLADTISDFVSELIIAQAKHESGNFKNSLTRNYNNIFSRLHSKYDSMSIGNYGYAEKRTGYAVYKSIDSATISQLQYFKRKKYSMKWSTVEEFAIELKQKRYYTDDINNYIRAMKKHMNSRK
jgi:flagellum-specific peptidoglycan hydrolase FlgJ